MQIRISTVTASSSLFEYVRRFLEIAFVVVILSACVKLLSRTTLAAMTAAQQMSTLMVNMQRIFAETVAGIITDPEIKKLIVLWGLCILPSISSTIGEFKKLSASSFSAADDSKQNKHGFMLM